MTADPFPVRSPLPDLAGRPAKAQLRIAPPDYLPARMLNEFVYCPRLFFYEWVEGVFAESADTVEGSLRHGKIDAHPDALPPAGTEESIHSRSVTLSSDTHKLIAKIDLIEGADGHVTPVDYKRGAPRDGDAGPEAWPADRAQVCAQALILRDNGYRCDEAVIYYSTTKQRVRVAIHEEIIAETLRALGEARTLAQSGEMPPPLVDSPKCPRCSLVSICLPDETAAARLIDQDDDGGSQLTLFSEQDVTSERRGAPDELRRLIPARDDLRPLYVTGHGLTVGKSGGVLQVRDGRQVLQEVRINEISSLNLFGSILLSSAVVHALCDADLPIAHFSSGGWFYGLTRGLDLKNVFLRREQFRLAEHDWFCLTVAREIVSSKIRNQRTLVQRNHLEPPAIVLQRLKRLAEQAHRAADLEALLGIEGTAARLYFESFAGMLKVEQAPGMPAFTFEQRNRRPPRDPINALLSLGYSLLARDLTITCHAVGFDPYVGFYHQPRFGRPALALDLMEGFRPLIADSAVLMAVNGRMVGPDDFVRAGEAVALTSRGRKAFIRAYAQRMDTLVTHPLFGYRVSYRRVLEIQARLLARVVMRELPRYPGFETR